jgi:hypothetical protein
VLNRAKLDEMKINRIQYTVQPGFAEKNKQNIAKVMEELRRLNHPGIHYSAYVLEDGKTFMHLVILKDEAASTVIPSLESFKHFQGELKAGNPEIPPKFEGLELAGASFEI